MAVTTRKPATVGDILLYEFLEPAALRINDLADMLNVHRNTISALVNNNRKLTVDIAFRLAKTFETSVEFWLNLQTNVDIWEVRNNPRLMDDINKVAHLKDFMKKS
ncbi:HigA family addiction module antitoxin [Rahnella aceris]|uniref:HigA family addiction module antitoxin n=1 Tax=Rahnella sp. (strain Y9602) TaxID=2703885 RepID=UPI003FD32118